MDRANLIELDEQRIADAVRDAARQNLRVRHEYIVSDELHFRAERRRERFPAVPVAFGQAVFDGGDRILAQPVFVQLNHLIRCPVGLARLLECVAAAAGPEFARRDVKRDVHILAGFHADFADGFEHRFNSVAIGFQIRCEAAFVADAGGLAARLEDAPERVKDFRAGAQRFGERTGADRHDHEFLKVDARVCVARRRSGCSSSAPAA